MVEERGTGIFSETLKRFQTSHLKELFPMGFWNCADTGRSARERTLKNG